METTNHNLLPGDPIFMRVILTIAVLYLAVNFVQAIVKLLLAHQLKRQMIEKNLSEETIRLILRAGSDSTREIALKWSLIFAGITIALIAIGLTQPNEVYSIAIITGGIALAFLVYYFIRRKYQPHA
ncbi:MAG TPA: hypothetical protein VHE59_03220 [Mucilaginibacter sp.]|nr:hypothetical protein [Mucilaginibacter sp.]